MTCASSRVTEHRGRTSDRLKIERNFRPSRVSDKIIIKTMPKAGHHLYFQAEMP